MVGFMAWVKRQKLASRAIVEGDLDLAAEYLKRDRFQKTYNGRRLKKQLTSALVLRAEEATSLGNLSLAWKDLSTATDLAGPRESDLISRHKTQLVELTIESADSLLYNGKITHAVQMIDQLGRRKILDWRADRIRNVSQCLQAAEEFAAFGKFTNSVASLEQAKNLQPGLPFLEGRLGANRQREIQMNELTAELQSSALKCHWSDVSKCCQKILLIAPKYQIALDAQKHCIQRIKRKTSAGVRVTNVPEKNVGASSFFRIDSLSGTPSRASPVDANGGLNQVESAPAQFSSDSFLMWVDGVGGYLVCVNRINTIGQAVDLANISIPIQGDLRRRHARLETVGGQHIIEPLGPVTIAEKEITAPVELKHQQIISLDGVRLKYTQSHPLSKTGRLDFVSRQRTSPWSDAVLLASQSIILGPNRDNHIYCPTWKSDLILFERHGTWYCRAKEAFEIDGEPFKAEGAIKFDSRISGEDYSLTLEPVLVRP
ncbi:MAG: hypothetical protein ACI87E_001578 [Mariniblastus sp.]|jgi:hypothetical protein